MRTWRPHRVLRLWHGALGVVGLLTGIALLVLALTDEDAGAPILAIAAVAVLASLYLLLLAFNRRVTLTESELRVRNLLRERRIPLQQVAEAAPSRGCVRVRLHSGEQVRVMAIGTYYWLASDLSRADDLAQAVNEASRGVRPAA
ncbi:PH domain-containing protein [Streptomyces sp. NPDC050418]|uniref:PH domain-containing protein n=1 Tax=Streptomyces sp. NPDC050418 TaxID=3365612 RepID=UPI0037B06553